MTTTTILSYTDRAVIVRQVERACSTYEPPMSPAQTYAAVQLALDLYATAAAHGLDRADADAVTSFPSAAIDGVRWTHRAPRRVP